MARSTLSDALRTIADSSSIRDEVSSSLNGLATLLELAQGPDQEQAQESVYATLRLIRSGLQVASLAYMAINGLLHFYHQDD